MSSSTLDHTAFFRSRNVIREPCCGVLVTLGTMASGGVPSKCANKACVRDRCGWADRSDGKGAIFPFRRFFVAFSICYQRPRTGRQAPRAELKKHTLISSLSVHHSGRPGLSNNPRACPIAALVSARSE